MALVAALLFAAPETKAQKPGRSDPTFSQPSLAPGVDYVVPQPGEIKASLDRIRDYFVRSTPYRIIDTETGQTITDLAEPTKTAGIDLRGGQFNDWDYPMGAGAMQSGNGMWHQLLDKTDSYLETSASAMFTFAIARGVNRGWLAPTYAPVAQTGWQAVATRVRPDGRIEGICVSTTAAYDAVYYYNRPTDLGAMQGYGPVLMAGTEVMTMLGAFDIDQNLNTFHYRARKR